MKVYQTISKGLGFVGMVAFLMMSFCTKDNPVQPKIDDNWTISGNVQDGYTGAFLDSAQIVYSDRDGKLKTIVTTSGGSFALPNLPYGNVTVTFKYTKGTTKYTTTVLRIASGDKADALTKGKDSTEFKFRDTSVVVNLFAMTGSVSGIVQTRVHAKAPLVAGALVPVKITYGSSDGAMEFASPRTFTAVAGNDGSFTIDSLPLASDATLTLLSATVGGVDFAQRSISIPDLIGIKNGVVGRVGLGTVVMDMPVGELDPSSKFQLLYNNFPTKQILPNGTMIWTLSNIPDDAASYAVLQSYGSSGATNTVVDSVIGNTFTVTPSVASLIDGDQYIISAFIYGKAGGKVFTVDTITVKSANTEQVVASNVLTATKQGISGLGLTDSIYFTFASNLKQASVSINHGAVVDLVTVVTSGNQIVIKPKGTWLAATSYNINVYGTLADGTPLSFQVSVSTEGSLNFVSSNVFDPLNPNTGKDGFVVDDTIAITANKPLSAANAILVDANGNRIPVTVTVTDVKVKVDPQVVLNFGTTYTLTFTMTSTTGEIKKATPSFMTISSNFYMISSNACIGGDASKPTTEFNPSEAITIEMSEQVESFTAALTSGGTAVATTTTRKVDEPKRTIVITPTNDKLSDNTVYSLSVTTSSVGDVRTTITINNFRTRSELFPVWSNVRMGNDPTKPVLNFDPLDNIIIVMSKNLAKATAQVSTGGTNVLASISIKGNDTIVINPEQPLVTSALTAYNVNISAEDVDGIKYTGTIVTGLIPVKGVFVVASNVLSGDFVSLTNVPIAVVPWFKMSVAPVAASIRATITGATSGTVDNAVTVKGDTLVVTPVSSFRYGEVVTVAFAGMATNGKSISESKSFTCEPAKTIRVVWSNVLNANLEGLTDVAVASKIKVLLSVSPKAGSITKADAPIAGVVTGVMGNAVITLSGDTIVISPVSNMNYNTAYRFTLTGLDVNNNSFTAVSVPASPLVFKTSQNVFVVASNLLDGNGDPKKTFNRFGAMWIKFSETLDTAKNVYTWANYNSVNAWVANPIANPADIEIVGEGSAGAPNATVRIAGDSLFVTPDNRAKIDFDQKVGFSVTIQTSTGKTATFAACVQTAPINLFVKATNTKDANGVMQNNFGYRDPVFVVSSVQLDSIISVRDSQTVAGSTTIAIPDAASGLLRSRVRLAATGDTIFYTPSVALSANTIYGMDFTVHVKNRPRGSDNANVLGLDWKTAAGVEITAINLLENSTTYRVFKVTGDSIMVTFSKAIDTSWNAATPFAVAGFVTNYTKRWSADLKTVTIKNVDSLSARTYSTTGDDYSTKLTGGYAANYTLTFSMTCKDGEVKTGLAGGGVNSFVPQVAVKTEYKLALIGSNTVKGHITTAAIGIGEASNDTFALAGNPTLVFNRAVDTARIKADAPSQYQNLIKLVVNGTTTPREFALTFSSDAKTITMNPATDLVAGTNYDIILTNVPAIGLKDADRFSAAGGGINSILTLFDFKALPAGDILIDAIAATIAIDTMDAALLFGNNKVGYTPIVAGSVAPGISQADGSFKIRIQKPAWNERYLDSITEYEVRVRNSVNSDWYIMTATVAAGSNFNSFDPTNLTSRRWINSTINVAADGAFANLQVPDADGAATDYTNGAKMLNDSTVVSLQVRPIKNNVSGFKSEGQWSNTIVFVDNVAPGDSDYTANVTLTENFGVVNRTAQPTDSSSYVDIIFPEDMRVAWTTLPTISFYQGIAQAQTPPSVAANTGWINGRTYRIFIKLTTGDNYSFGFAGWYYKVTVAGMKDRSGVTLQPTGIQPAPAAANLTTYAAMGATTPPTQGNQQVGTGDGKPGYYQFP